MNLFIDSFVSFTVFPLRIVTGIGFLMGLGTIIYAFILLGLKLSGKTNVEGWTAMMLAFLIVSSFQMIALGIIGEYLWRTLDSVRKRPVYVIDSVIQPEPKK